MTLLVEFYWEILQGLQRQQNRQLTLLVCSKIMFHWQASWKELNVMKSWTLFTASLKIDKHLHAGFLLIWKQIELIRQLSLHIKNPTDAFDEFKQNIMWIN